LSSPFFGWDASRQCCADRSVTRRHRGQRRGPSASDRLRSRCSPRARDRSGNGRRNAAGQRCRGPGGAHRQKKRAGRQIGGAVAWLNDDFTTQVPIRQVGHRFPAPVRRARSLRAGSRHRGDGATAHGWTSARADVAIRVRPPPRSLLGKLHTELYGGHMAGVSWPSQPAECGSLFPDGGRTDRTDCPKGAK
jgi:hypothetical protein